jgi:hypothetical protein
MQKPLMAAIPFGERRRKGHGMRKKLAVAAGGVLLVGALGVSTGAQASVSQSGTARTPAVSATPDGLSPKGYGYIWNPGADPDGSPTTGMYAYVSEGGGSPMAFAPLTELNGDGYSPWDFENVSVTNVNGAFEIVDLQDPGSDGEYGCLAADTANGTIHDDTPTACYKQDYSWDQWTAINTGGTYHSQTLWEFENKDTHDCIFNNGDDYVALYEPCVDSVYEQFTWNGSNL